MVRGPPNGLVAYALLASAITNGLNAWLQLSEPHM